MNLLITKSKFVLFVLLITLAYKARCITQTKDTREKINLALSKAKTNLTKNKLSESLYLAQTALNHAKETKDTQKAWEAQNLIGEIYLTQNKFQKAIHLFLEMCIRAEKNNNYSISANGYLSLANIYSHMGAFTKADETYELAYSQFDQIDYEVGTLEVRAAASLNLITAGNHQRALSSFQKLLSLAKKSNLAYFKLIAHDGLLEVFVNLQNYEKGIEVGKTYLKLIETEGGSYQMAANAHNQMASLYLGDGRNKEALVSLSKAEKIGHGNLINDRILANTYELMSKTYLVMGDDTKAAEYSSKFASILSQFPAKVEYHPNDFDEAEILARALEKKSKEIIVKKELIEQEKEKNKRQDIQADEIARLKFLEHEALIGHRDLGHSALEAEYIHQDLMVAQHEFESTERQIEILRYKERLIRQELELKVAEEEKLIMDQRAEIAAKKQQIYLIIVGALLLIVIILGVEYIRIRKLTKLMKSQQNTIHQRNAELQKSNATILDKNSKLKKAHDDLKQTHANLIQAEKMSALGMLTAGIAHEVNNPIGFVTNGLQVLEENISEAFDSLSTYEQVLELEDFDEIKNSYNVHKTENPNVAVLKKDTAALLKDVKFGTTRITEIVDGLRIFSRKDEKKFKKAHLNEIIDSALLISKSKYKNRIEIIKEYGKGIHAIDCFPGQLNQIFINLISNASDAIEGKGRIKIVLQNVSKKYVRAIILDSGKGMTQDVKQKIFEPLYTTKDSNMGTGLGLSITADIMKTHKGHIAVKSKVGFGTAFILTFHTSLNNNT